MENLGIVAFFVFVVMVPVMALINADQKSRLGTVKCNRCGYVGKTKGQFVTGRGMKQVCATCHGDDWQVVVPAAQPQGDTVKCGACGNVGSPRAVFVTGRGMKQVCANCNGDIKIN